jgi:endoglucanase
MKNLIRKLVEVSGPSGYESRIRDCVIKEVEPLIDEVRIDNLGNLIVRKGDKAKNGLRIMVAAHIDEIGVMVSHVDEQGYIRFMPIGGLNVKVCLGSRVRFLNGELGVIGSELAAGGSKAFTFEQLFIDLGWDAHGDPPVKVGDVGVFEGGMLEMGERIVSKALDDRISVAVLIETLRRMDADNVESPHEIYFVFSVQEEVGLRGANTAAFGIEPDLGLAVDVTRTGDTPRSAKMEVSLGKGPAIKVRDQRMISDPRVVKWMAETAEKAQLPFQLEVLERGTTDAGAIQLSRAGVPAGCLSIPCRYLHTPSEMVDYRDVQNSVALMIELLRDPIELSGF